MSAMQGTLWKWTNYISGWQPRWFVLESGILSYYISRDEVTQGSRRAYKVVSCDVNVDKNDELRMHIITPDKGCIYLRASSKTERQNWVLALASAKLTDPPLDKSQQDSVYGRKPVKTKMTELRETCNHLLTQIGNIKSASKQTPPDVKSLEALSSTLTITCDDFVRVLQECMDLSHNSSVAVTPVGMGGGIGYFGPPRAKKGSFSDDESRSLTRHSPHTPSPHHTPPTKHKRVTPIPATNSLPFHLLDSRASQSPDKHVTFDKEETGTEDSAGKTVSPIPESKSSRSHSRTNSDLFLTPNASPNSSPPPSPTIPPLTAHASTSSPAKTIRDRALANRGQRSLFKDVKVENKERKFVTFFSRAEPSFGDIVLLEGDMIPTNEFLECSRAVLPFFDALSPTAFAPVKADVGGNIEKVFKKYNLNPDLLPTIQSIVEDDINKNTAGTDSATEALLWLKRAMEFIYLFIGEIARGEQAMDVAAGKAYSKSLRRHHNWMVRGIFSLAMRAVPYYPDFMAILGSDGTEESLKQVILDMTDFAQNMGEIVVILDQFLVKTNIESEH